MLLGIIERSSRRRCLLHYSFMSVLMWGERRNWKYCPFTQCCLQWNRSKYFFRTDTILFSRKSSGQL